MKIIFHSVGNVIIPTDELIFFRGVGIPPTRIPSNYIWIMLDDSHVQSFFLPYNVMFVDVHGYVK